MSAQGSVIVAIRPWAEDDFALLERLLGDPAMTEYLGGPEKPEKLRDRHGRYLRVGESSTGRMYVIESGAEKSAAGAIGYWEKSWQGDMVWESGWSVLQAFQGRGIATRAVALVAAQARGAALHRYLHAFPAVENAASNRVCEKAGLVLLGPYDFEYPPGSFMRCNDWQVDLFPERG